MAEGGDFLMYGKVVELLIVNTGTRTGSMGANSFNVTHIFSFLSPYA